MNHPNLTAGRSDTERRAKPWWAWGCTGEMAPHDIGNWRRVNLWTVTWLVVFAAGTIALKRWGDSLGLAAWAVALVPSVIFVLVLWSFVRFLREADELTRKIHLEALSTGFGAGIFFMLGYPLLERAGAPQLDSADLLMVMALTWAVAVWIGQRRYA